MTPPRILLFAPSLGAGGAERVLSILADAWAARGRDVAVVTLAARDTDFYTLAPSVRRIGLDVMGDSAGPAAALFNNLRRVGAARKAFHAVKPDVVISFCDRANVVALLASRGLGCPVVVSERVDPSRHPAGAPWAALRRIAYRRADAVAVQTGEVARWVAREIGPVRTAVIPNPVRPVAPASGANRDADAPTLMAMGRLVPQKGFDLLLEAFAVLADSHPAWRLAIVGEGEARRELEAQAGRLGLAGRVGFTGRVADPEAHLDRADVFVLSSRYEGFPNALLEAMALGLPVVSFDCPSGPSAIIRPGVDGVLVPAEDVPALARALDALMADAAERRRLGENARAVAGRFSLEAVLGLWEQVIAEVRA